MKKIRMVLAAALLLIVVLGAVFFLRSPYLRTIRAGRNQKVVAFIRHPQEHQDWVLEAGTIAFMLYSSLKKHPHSDLARQAIGIM